LLMEIQFIYVLPMEIQFIHVLLMEIQFIYVLSMEIQLSSGRVGILLNRFNPHMCVHISSQGLDFYWEMSSLLCWKIWGERWLFILLILVEILTLTV
jgi:hypothetical protein